MSGGRGVLIGEVSVSALATEREELQRRRRPARERQ